MGRGLAFDNRTGFVHGLGEEGLELVAGQAGWSSLSLGKYRR